MAPNESDLQHDVDPRSQEIECDLPDLIDTTGRPLDIPLDNPSFRHNDEAILIIYDRGWAERLEDVFEADLKRSRRIGYDEWKRRPFRQKMVERFSSLLSSQL